MPKQIVAWFQPVRIPKSLPNTQNKPIWPGQDQHVRLLTSADSSAIDYRIWLVDFRQNIMPFLSDEFSYLMDADKGLKKAVVTSAVELDKNNRNKVDEYVSSILNNAYELKFDIDSKIIGGFLLRIDDKVYDRSIKGRLNSIKNEIIK